MDNIRRIQVFLKRFFIMILIMPGSIFAGVGIVTILHWLGYTTIPDAAAINFGASAIFILYVIPQGFTYLMARREILKYFPITNDLIRNHRQFYLNNIDEEIKYLQQAIEAFRTRGMRDDYNVYLSGLNTFTEIKSLVQSDLDLKVDHLKTLNQVFNKRYLLKKLQN